MSILIKNIELNKKIQDILIEGNTIARIGSSIDYNADIELDGTNKAVVPGLFNGHTHAAMSLMRGYADDMPLMPWLQEKIWPLEKNITEEDVYWGTKLACLEMIKTGTTLFIDMYHHAIASARATDEMGIRGMLTLAVLDFNDKEISEKFKKEIEQFHRAKTAFSNRLEIALGPHAIYTVSKEMLCWMKGYARANNIRIQTHLSETEIEVKDSISMFGCRPVNYLNSIGFLGPEISFAHSIYINDEEIKMLADNGCQVIHNPASNLKLASGTHFRYGDLKKAGITVGIGTDGACSGNNLDMYEAMKLASLNAKAAWNDPTLWNADETFAAATKTAEIITGFKTGTIDVGYLADIALIDLKKPEMTPNFNLISNLVYSANGSVVDTLICDGNIIMKNHHVDGEEEIISKANEIAHNLVARKK